MVRAVAIDSSVELLGLLEALLMGGGYEVETFSDSADAVRSFSVRQPNIVICEANMPDLDGFGVLSALRKNPETASVPFIFLTTMDDIASYRMAMRGGADDYLLKPLNPRALLEAIATCLEQSHGAPLRRSPVDGNTRVAEPASSLPSDSANVDAAAFVAATVVATEIAQAPASAIEQAGPTPRNVQQGTLIHFGVRDFALLSGQLTTEAIAEVSQAFFTRACEPILQQNGWIVTLGEEAAVAMFDHMIDDAEHHAVRGLRAALHIVQAAVKFRPWLEKKFPDQDLSSFAISVGVHSGDVEVNAFDRAGALSVPAVAGDIAAVVAQLETQARELGWSIVASQETLALADGQVEHGRIATLPMHDNGKDFDVVEITGLAPRTGVAGSNESKAPHELREAVLANAVASAHRSGGVLPSISGYKILGTLGKGGMSEVYLAEPATGVAGESSSVPCVLKLVPIHEKENAELIHRFIQEYALVSQINHPNVARIYAQGFTKSHAYIAMEYLPGGDLNADAKAGVAADTALAYLRQVTMALQVIHAAGIVHRDLKPSNIMRRDDGSLVLADFGIAKDLTVAMTETHNNQVFGTPYYISPEQVRGKRADPRSDIYSLGAMLFEFLTGRRAYNGTSVEQLMRMHLQADTPTLPEHLFMLQPLIDSMMAKDINFRIGSTTELLEILPTFEGVLGQCRSAPAEETLAASAALL